jgi:hypothetical protein
MTLDPKVVSGHVGTTSARRGGRLDRMQVSDAVDVAAELGRVHGKFACRYGASEA